MAASHIVAGVWILGLAVGLATYLRRATRVSYRVLGGGALVFVASQLVHLPLNMGLGAVLPQGPGGLVISALAIGLSAALCEELARYVAIRWLARSVRHTEGALMLGMGHGGLEALIVAGLTLFGAFQLLALDQNPELLLGELTPEQRLEAMASIEQIRAAPVLLPLLGALERTLVLPFHLAATLLVTVGVSRGEMGGRRSGLWLLAAIAMHALLDGPMAYLSWTVGPAAAELWIAGMCVASLLVLWGVGRRHRRPRVVREPPPSSGAPLELLDAHKRYPGPVHALRAASLTLEAGTRTCLLGPNGAGKTTSIRLLTGGIAASAGHARLFGRDSGDPAFLESKRRLGLVPQLPGMYEDLRVIDWLELVAALYQRGDVAATSAALGLEPLLDRPMGKLSGGQKRRVAIGAAVLGEPDLLILDEPTAGLDPVASREVMDYLGALGDQHTILLCTHDLEEAEALCEDVIVMRDGRVLVHESIDALRGRLAPTLRLRVKTEAEEARAALERASHAAVIEGDTLFVEPADAEAEASTILRALLDADVDVVECHLVRPTLEAVFLEIVQGAPDIEEEALDPDEEEPLPPAAPLRELFDSATRLLALKEWRQLRASGAAFWTSLLLPAFFVFFVPQMLIAVATLSGEAEASDTPPPDFGFLADIGDDPSRIVIVILPLFVTIASLIAPVAIITHSIVHERETRTFELLVALPVRIQQVIAAKIACAFGFTAAVCGGCVLLISIELLALGLATIVETAALFVLLLATLAHSTAGALWVAVLAKDARTANNLAGAIIAPSMFAVMAITAVSSGPAIRALVIGVLFSLSALALARAALRSATFEKLLA